MIQRAIKISKQKSFFLFGARATGKSWLLDQLFNGSEALFIQLLDPELADRLTAYPNELKIMLEAAKGKKPWVVIDEVQKVPKLLDIVHHVIAQKQFKFALTGSSARKLKRGAANLLAGRASVFHLFPLTHRELAASFDLEAALAFGTLPEVALMSDDMERRRFLKAYVQTYMKEEIISEQIVRNLPPFRRFLDVAAQQNAEIVHYSNIAKDVGSDPKTISNYFEILQDTLVGMLLPAFERSIRRQQKTAPKFYFFDLGIVRALTGQFDYRPVSETYEYGKLFETWVVNETHRLMTYRERHFKLSYLRLSEKLEVDLIIEQTRQPVWLCEIKASSHVDERHVAGVVEVAKKLPKAEKFLISNDLQRKIIAGVTCLHWREWFDSWSE